MRTKKRNNDCGFHRSGLPPWAKTTDYYDDACPKCRAKKTAGIVTGNEPTPGALYDQRKLLQAREACELIAKRKAAEAEGRVILRPFPVGAKAGY